MTNDVKSSRFETRVQTVARAFPYPATPNLSARVRLSQRGSAHRTPRWAWALLLIGLACAGLMAVPAVRAAVLEFIQIGVIRIFPGEDVPPLPMEEDPVLPAETSPVAPFVLDAVFDLAGEMSLEQAREQAAFPIRLPGYPPEIGAPDRVYVQNLEGGQGVFLVWLDPEIPERVRLSLLILGPRAFAGKSGPDRVVETTVNGARAVWMEGEHFLVLKTVSNGYDALQFFVRGHVLVWEVDGITHRLESEWAMEEAIRLAESLR